MHIPQTVIDELNTRVEIVDLLGKYIQIKKRTGQSYFACCPFHNEKSPSFSINAAKQMYHCFGCGESGNAISFIMKYQSLDFVSAVKYLSNEYGVIIPESENQIKFTQEEYKKQKQRKEDINDTINKALSFYRQQLTVSAEAKEYLMKRGLNAEIIEKFEIGFVPDGYQLLATKFNDYNTNQHLIDSGLITTSDSSNKRYDRFRNRIMFPIKNILGKIIGFGGRVISSGDPKYLNSPETELFNKSLELYGFCESKKDIRDLNQVFVVEGYMDVIALHQYGIQNAVATMGTAATEEHIKQMFKYCDHIVYSFDGDVAGFKAAWRALERSVGLITDTKSVSFLFLPNEHDPDSYIREYGIEKFKLELKENGIGLIQYLLKQLAVNLHLVKDEDKAKLISFVKPFLEQIKAPAVNVLLKQQLARLVELDPGAVESILNNKVKYAFNKRFFKLSQSYEQNLSRSPLDIKLLENILFSLINNPLLAREIVFPNTEVLKKLNMEILSLLKLIDYYVMNYDSFEDININIVASMCTFEQVNLIDVFNKVKFERLNYKSTFGIDEVTFREMINKLISGKRRAALPQLPN